MIITIDGPVASGKSTIGRLLAHKLGAYYLYSGLLYRALAYLLMRDYGYTIATIGNPITDHVAALLKPERLTYTYDEPIGERISADGIDITFFLKDALIDQAASIMSTNNEVRTQLNVLQRQIAHDKTIIIDGRDAGSVVFPHAPYKFFLTAEAHERAQRWQKQQEQRGNSVTVTEALLFLHRRDHRDSTRSHAPLIIPHGAHVIDTTGMPIEAVVDTMRRMVLTSSRQV
jgi:cytidylate kinase